MSNDLLRRISSWILILFTVLACFSHICGFWNTLKCFWQVRESINDICRKFDEGLVSGDLCSDLCHGNQLNIDSCNTAHLAKKLVFSVEHKRKRIILKSKFRFQDDFNTLTENNNRAIKKLLTERIQDILRMRFDLPTKELERFSRSKDAIKKLWNGNADVINTNTSADADSLWSLLQQEEYVLFKYFSNSKLFPRVLGTCGHLYATEYNLPLIYILGQGWEFRSEIARKILAMVDDLEVSLWQPLHLCDVKLDHFGIDSDANVKILDADNAYFLSVLQFNVEAQRTCDSHSDCAFFSCKSPCDFSHNNCSKVSNNNLQVICEELLAPRTLHWFPGLFLPPLLHSPPFNMRGLLGSALGACANPTESKDGDLRGSTPDYARRYIFKILTHVIS